jgi:hypothetical protein
LNTLLEIRISFLMEDPWSLNNYLTSINKRTASRKPSTGELDNWWKTIIWTTTGGPSGKLLEDHHLDNY